MIVHVQNGHTSEYVAVVQTYQQSIYRYCLRLLRNQQDAEDAAQDIFIKAFESIRHYKHTVSFSSWLYKIAYRHCLNLLRKRKYQLLLLPRLFKPEAAAESPEQAMDKRLFSPPLMFALTALSPEDRSVLILRIFEERTYEELSEIMGCKPEAAKKRVSRIKEKVRRAMLKWQGEEIWDENNQTVNLKV
ncbi:RNA polymerase sigma factor [Paenibacillus eucommiae]|uniref:RNA polymerase sigma-70 factor (ECF subfamily) n=1 Tax=Paenibacillus eucommiae TaxID=1355755 RepID=A0ABS4J4U9_9BACL|nr:sigma-70 family RNA polymerase sigma factor [Paenibacillus eucommiae]MBP1994864.1 RNA polymerase sigma-70 factor (ECF subfamily) [Paenibacillus eucommiae]